MVDQFGSPYRNNQEMNSFSSTLMLACSVKINNIKSDEECEEDKNGRRQQLNYVSFTYH